VSFRGTLGRSGAAEKEEADCLVAEEEESGMEE
jgi:hypothetical protein